MEVGPALQLEQHILVKHLQKVLQMRDFPGSCLLLAVVDYVDVTTVHVDYLGCFHCLL
jgi:hypothetical protein